MTVKTQKAKQAVWNKKWTKEASIAKARECKTIKELQILSFSAYNAIRANGWMDEAYAHMSLRRDHSLESCKKIAKKYKTRGEFQSGDLGAYSYAHKSGILDAVCSHMKAVNKTWTKKDVALEAKKYNTKYNFMKGCPSGYQKAFKSGWLDEVTAHMVSGWSVMDKKWTKEVVWKEAKKYKTRYEFRKKSPGAESAAQRHGWIDEVCSHMTRSSGENNVIYIWRAKELTYDGLPVYKMGYTSEKHGSWRIDTVAKKAGLTAQVITLSKVMVAAHKVERELHQLGKNPRYENFDGCTEFRALTKSELKQAIAIVEKYAA